MVTFGIAFNMLQANAIADVLNADVGLMALVNLVAINLLGKWAFAAIRDFHRQLDGGRDPVFVADSAGLPGTLEGDIWTESVVPLGNRDIKA